jgi:hypothetical protein
MNSNNTTDNQDRAEIAIANMRSFPTPVTRITGPPLGMAPSHPLAPAGQAAGRLANYETATPPQAIPADQAVRPSSSRQAAYPFLTVDAGSLTLPQMSRDYLLQEASDIEWRAQETCRKAEAEATRAVNNVALCERGGQMNHRMLSSQERMRILDHNDGVVPENWVRYEEFMNDTATLGNNNYSSPM